MRPRWLVVTPAALLLTGCAALSGSHPDLPPGEGNTIAWTSATPTAFQHHLATPVPGSPPTRCEATDLRGGFRGGPDGGTVYLSPQTSTCVVGGIPTIQLLASDGPIPMTQVVASPTAATDVVLVREFVIRPDLQPGEPVPPPLGGAGEGTVAVVWHQADAGSNVCASGVKRVSSMRLVLPDQTTGVSVENLLDQQGQPLTVCPPFIQASAIGLDAIATNKSLDATGKPPDATGKPLDAPRYWNFTVAVPTNATAGRTMDFKVGLQNVYYRALQFSDGCPSYVEALAGPNDWTTGKEWYVLNCEPMGVVQPGATVMLAMKIAILPSAPAGAYTLVWEMDVGDVSYGAATATFHVTPAAS